MDKLFGMAGLAILDNRSKGWAGQYMTDVVVMETMEGFEPCSTRTFAPFPWVSWVPVAPGMTSKVETSERGDPYSAGNQRLVVYSQIIIDLDLNLDLVIPIFSSTLTACSYTYIILYCWLPSGNHDVLHATHYRCYIEVDGSFSSIFHSRQRVIIISIYIYI